MTAATYRTIVLPRTQVSDDTWKSLVLKQKAFRLEALKESPQAFGNTYEREAAYGFDVWEERLKKPEARTIIAVPKSVSEPEDTSDLKDALSKPWMGWLILNGPVKDHVDRDSIILQENSKADDKVASVDDSPEREQLMRLGVSSVPHYNLNALYVVTAARGTGLGHLLLKAVESMAEELGREAKAPAVRLTLIVDYYNVGARSLYTKGGFSIIKRYFFKDIRTSKHPEDPLEETEAAVMEKILA